MDAAQDELLRHHGVVVCATVWLMHQRCFVPPGDDSDDTDSAAVITCGEALLRLLLVPRAAPQRALLSSAIQLALSAIGFGTLAPSVVSQWQDDSRRPHHHIERRIAAVLQSVRADSLQALGDPTPGMGFATMCAAVVMSADSRAVHVQAWRCKSLPLSTPLRYRRSCGMRL